MGYAMRQRRGLTMVHPLPCFMERKFSITSRQRFAGMLSGGENEGGDFI
jgi:hypothetical protein